MLPDWALVVALWVFWSLAAWGQSPGPATADPHIAAALKQISAEHVRQTIDKLVSFGTRSTLSAQDDDSINASKGIGAAREWIKAELERYSKDCGGCLQVTTDSVLEQPTERIPKRPQTTNVYGV